MTVNVQTDNKTVSWTLNKDGIPYLRGKPQVALSYDLTTKEREDGPGQRLTKVRFYHRGGTSLDKSNTGRLQISLPTEETDSPVTRDWLTPGFDEPVEVGDSYTLTAEEAPIETATAVRLLWTAPDFTRTELYIDSSAGL